MGLDVYAGPLTRYYAGDWETVVQRFGREQGMDVQVVRVNEPPEDEELDPSEIMELVCMWRDALLASLAEHVGDVSPWNESAEHDYVTDKPTWDGLGGLRLWAAYSAHPDMTMPAVLPENWVDDPALAASLADGPDCRYKHIVRNVELWIPLDFPFTLRSEDAAGNERELGSTVQLLRDLDRLNAETWGADPDALAQWRQGFCKVGDPIEVTAKAGFGIFRHLAHWAVQNHMPMILDY